MTWFHKYFIPHQGNEYKPHLLRSEIAFAILAFILIIEGAFLSQAVLLGRGTGFLALVLPNTLVDQANHERVAANLAPLAENPLLTAAAQAKANDMAAKGYFAHTSPEGITPWYWFKQMGYNYVYAGENLAVNFSDSEDVTDAWMRSPGHRDNILGANYTQIGIATAQGKYQGSPTIFVVQLFGKPAAPKPAPAPVVATAPKPAAAPAPKPAPAPAPEPIIVPPQQNFIAVVVEGSATETVPAAAAPQPIPAVTAGETAAPVAGTTQPAVQPQSNFMQRIFAAPRMTVNFVYLAIGLLIVLALLLNVLVKASVQHPQLVLNGLMILLALGTLAVFNQHLLLANAQIF
jgi:hypothetical protein